MLTLVFGESLRDAHGYIRAKGMPLETTRAAFDSRALKGIVEKTQVLLLKYHSLNHYWLEFKNRLEELEKQDLVRIEFREDW
jgi:hypothetical protein